MTGRGEHQMGPGPGYTGLPATPPPPADETTRTAALGKLRRALARRGPPCHCGHGSHVHRHRDPSAAHCGITRCDCTSYRKASP